MSKRESESASSYVHGRRPRAGALVGLGFVVLAAGCASVTTLDGERLSVRSDAFASYVERVFREQNRVATALAFAFEDAALPARIDALEAAEEALLTACAELNALAAARRGGERLGPMRGLSAARQAPDCERATAGASRLLEQAVRRPAP